MTITRRHALFGSVFGGLAGCATSFGSQSFIGTAPTRNAVFAHGVASGDPATDSVVLWTRITTDQVTVPVQLEISEHADFSKSVRTLATETSPARDHTVKIVADGLTPGTHYYYRFSANGTISPQGRTKTLPENASKARFAVASCSNYPFGYFNAYDHMARQADIDAVIHLGDYIYEYSRLGYGGKDGAALGREHLPATEIISLSDYRQRHAQYKSDPGAQAVHAAHPFIMIWDDHETANDSWSGGAENHQAETEGEWQLRQAAALQAYYEWMPIRDPEPGQPRAAIFKSYSWGGLLTLTSIETRLTARTQQLDYDEIVPLMKTQADIDKFRDEVIGAPDRQLLGAEQLGFIESSLQGSVDRGEPWRVVANQVIMARVTAPDLELYVSEEDILELEKQWSGIRGFIAFSKLGLPVNMDAWDGYPAARQRLYEAAQRAGAKDLVVLTGDTHEAWGNDLYDDHDQKMGVELGTTSVTSPGSPRFLGDSAAGYSLLLRRENRDVRFHDPMSKGYMLLTLEEDRGSVDYIALSTVTSPSYSAATTAQFDLKKEDASIAFANPRGLGFKERFLY